MAPIIFLSAYVINATDNTTPSTTINVAIIIFFISCFQSLLLFVTHHGETQQN